MNNKLLETKESNIGLKIKLYQSIIILITSLSLISFLIKLFTFDAFVLLNNILEITLFFLGIIILFTDFLIRKKAKKVKPKTLMIVSIIVLIALALLYVFSKVYLLKQGFFDPFNSPGKYLNLMLALLYSGVIILLILYKEKRVSSILKTSLLITSLFLFLILASFLFDLPFSGPSIFHFLVSVFIYAFLNTVLHYVSYLLYTYLKAKDEAIISNNQTSIVKPTLILFVALYALFAVTRDINHILYVHFLGPNLSVIILQIAEADLLFFVYSTLFITLVIFSLKSSLNKNNPGTKTIVNSAVTLWLVKILNNVLVRIIQRLLTSGTISPEQYTSLRGVLTTIGLIFNITLLLLGLLIIFKNKFPHLKLWLGLAIVQVLNFAINMIFTLIAKGEASIFNSEVMRLSVNFTLTLAKLIFVFLIIIQYQKPINLDPLPRETELTV